MQTAMRHVTGCRYITAVAAAAPAATPEWAAAFTAGMQLALLLLCVAAVSLLSYSEPRGAPGAAGGGGGAGGPDERRLYQLPRVRVSRVKRLVGVWTLAWSLRAGLIVERLAAGGGGMYNAAPADLWTHYGVADLLPFVFAVILKRHAG